MTGSGRPFAWRSSRMRSGGVCSMPTSRCRPDGPSQQQPVHAHRCRTSGVRRSARRCRDRRVGSHSASARSGSAVGGRAALAGTFRDLRPAPFERIEPGGPAADWSQHRPGGVARGSRFQPPPGRVPGHEPQPPVYRCAARRGPRPPRRDAADAAPACGCRVDGAPGHLCERREPAPLARGVARAGSRRADRDRRQPPKARPSVAHRIRASWDSGLDRGGARHSREWAAAPRLRHSGSR